jgi:universal stress protein A
VNRVRKVLVPVNFSDESANGLRYAASLAEETQAELVVLHVTQKEEAQSFLNFLALMEGCPMLNTPTTIPVDRLVREKALDLYRFVEKVVKNPGRLKIRRKVALGTEEGKILGVAKEEDVDLVVLPMQKKSFLSHLVGRRGLVKMILKFPCPVLLNPSFGAPGRHLA